MRILHAIHDFLPRHCAGSEIYAFELARAQVRAGHEIHILCAEYDPQRSHSILTWRWHEDLPITELVNNWHFGSFADTYASEQITRQLEHVLTAVQPDVLHIHNLLNLSFDLPAVASARGITSVATLHEFVLVCPSGGQRVHLAEEHICHEIEPERCARCFKQSPFYSQMVFAQVGSGVAGLGPVARFAAAIRRHFPTLFERLGRAVTAQARGVDVTTDDIERRLASLSRVYESVDLFVAPSPALASDFRRFGMPKSKIEVSDYGFVPFEPSAPTAGEGRLRIGFIGTLVWHKGAHVLIEAVRLLPADLVDVRVFGSLDTFPAYAAELRAAAAGLPIRFEGGFEPKDAAAVYSQLDVVAICSLWPENSPLVIHEAFMSSVPVVGARMGGIVDLVEHERSGLLYDAFSPEDLAGCLQRLIDNPGLLEDFRGTLPAVKTIDDDAREWIDRYENSIHHRTKMRKKAR